jgi:hypothetical protein
VRRPSVRIETLAAVGLVVALLCHTAADPDLWGHLAFGRQTLHDGLGRTDVFSYTAPGAPVLNHEWLSDVITYAVFATLGPVGVVGLRLALLVAMLGLVCGAVRRAGGDGLAAALVAALVVVGGFPWFVTARPQLYTFVGLALFLTAMTRADAGDARGLLATPLATVAWVNLHGGVVAGLALLGCWGALRVAQALRADDRRRAATIAVALALHVPAALANPFGVALWRFFAATLVVRRPEIAEWQHVSPTDLGDLLGVVALAAMAALVVRSGERRDPVQLILAALLCGAALSARRHLALALVATAIVAAPHAAAVLSGVAAPGRTRAPAVAALTAAALLATAGLTRAGCVVVEPGTVPYAAVEYLKRAGVDGRLAVLFDWGSYAIWHLSPRVHVSIDGRREAVYSPAQLAEHATFLYGSPGWRAPLDRDRVDVALVSPRFAVYRRLGAEPDWRRAFDDGTAAVFVRRGSIADGRLAAAPAPPVGPGPLCLSRGG